MNPSRSPEQALRSVLPVLLVLVVLIAGVIIMPTFTADPRSSASEPKPAAVTPSLAKPRPTFPPQTNTVKPEITCSELYSPVCDSVKNITYPNPCEANLAGATRTTKGECPTPTKILLPSTN